MNKKKIFKILVITALVIIVTGIGALIAKYYQAGGFSLVLGFVLLAIGIRGHEQLRGFSYALWIFASVSLSLLYPQWFIRIGSFELKNSIIPLLQIIMFGMGSQMSLKDFEGVIKMPKGVVVGVICQFTIMPFVGAGLAAIFNFPPEIAAGIVLVGCSPSGLASNVMSFLARANLVLSITLTAIATLLSPLLTPMMMKLLAGQFIEIDFWSMMLGIFNMVILPIIAGLTFNLFAYGKGKLRSLFIQLTVYIGIIILKNMIGIKSSGLAVSQFFSGFLNDVILFTALPVFGGYIFKIAANGRKDILDKVLAFISMLGIGIIIVIITASGRDSLLDVGFLLIIACLMHNVIGYGLGYSFSKLLRMPEKDCRTIALEVGMQNGGLASGLALQMGKVATVGLAPAVFGPMMNITGSSLATWWRKK